MSDKNSQSPIKLIASIKEQSIGTKTSLEQINIILQQLHKNILKESCTKNVNKSSKLDEIEENEENKDNLEDDKKKRNNKEEKEKKKLESNGEKEIKNIENTEINDNSDIISNININKIKNANDYKTSMDINIINGIGIKKKEEEDKEHNNNINDNNINNYIKEDIKEEGDSVNKNDNNNKNNNNVNKGHKNREYVYKEIDDITESDIFPNELNLYNISQGSELYLNDIIDKLGGEEENSSVKEDDLNNINNMVKDNNIIIQERDSDSVKIDSEEDLKLRLTNIPISDDKDDTSLLTNELNKACIRTNDNIKSKDYLSNIDMDIPRENEKEDGGGKPIKRLSKKNSKNSNNINNDKKTGIEMLFNNQDQNKDEHSLIEETKKEIYNEIDNMYESKLNLVKINNKEKFSYITKYNDPDKEKFGYESDFFYCSKNSINFMNRRNNFLRHKYFSYILSKKEKNNNNLNKKKDKKNKDKKTKDDSIDVNDNFVYINEEVNNFKKNYNEKFEPLTMNVNYMSANSNHDDIKELKIYDIEDMTSFYYYFNLYSPLEDFKKVLEEDTENDIINFFTSYRKVLNDGNSFKRAFSFLLLENLILKNKIKKLDFIIYDIYRMLSKKFKDLKQICNLLIDIKENSSIEYLMNSYNNPNLNFDEVMITYIEDTIKNVMGIENSKRKYQEIDFNTLRILSNVFDINFEIFYIEENDNNNGLLKMEKIILYNDIFLQTKKNIKASSYSEYDSSTTFRLLFFLNSFYIIYTKKSDIDSTLANNNNEKQYYYVPSLPKYKCPTCKKNTGLDILSSYEAIFCHICLNKYLNEILQKRAVLFVKSNFSCIEYYTRPIKITSDIIITFSLYKYITKNYITYDFEKIVERVCFKCFEIFEKEKINKLNCMCQLCDNCLEKLLKENIKKKVCLNAYELNTIVKTKCLCQNEVDLLNLMELSKNKPTEKDLKRAEDRLLEIIKKRCCLCNEEDPLKIFEIEIVDGPKHFMCINCHEKDLKNDDNFQNIDKLNKNGLDNDFLSEFESDSTMNKDKKITKKKIFCQICFKEHIIIQDNEIEKQNLIEKVVKFGENKFRCCKGKCSIF